MKAIIVFCLVLKLATSYSQEHKRIVGNGDLKVEKKEFRNFDTIESRNIERIYITYGKTESVTVQTDENIQPHLIAKKEGRKLIFDVKRISISPSKGIIIRINMPIIKGLIIQTSGSIRAEGNFVSNSDVTLVNDGSGDLYFSFAFINNLKVILSSAGDIVLNKGKVTTMETDIRGSGKLESSNVLVSNKKNSQDAN